MRGIPERQALAPECPRGGSELSAVPGKGCSAAEVSGWHHEPGLPRGCFPGPVRPYGMAYIVGV